MKDVPKNVNHTIPNERFTINIHTCSFTFTKILLQLYMHFVLLLYHFMGQVCCSKV